MMERWGLKVEIANHAFDRTGHFLAGRDVDRLADFNDALRDPGVRAIFTTRGGKGAYRLAHALDFAARPSRPEAGHWLQRSPFCTWLFGDNAGWQGSTGLTPVGTALITGTMLRIDCGGLL